ncbi:conserved phage C-terminal domain-containing protein [Streptococcus agalactiae]|uniref:conserved phage C-terminal domain-containing protein n=1 Tax=Streptococcus agalactiae TaxID=1311 RepID=UPI00355C9321
MDKKTNQWLKDTKMSEYLRPETLFGTKFESYLNQPESNKSYVDDYNIEELPFRRSHGDIRK